MALEDLILRHSDYVTAKPILPLGCGEAAADTIFLNALCKVLLAYNGNRLLLF
jgi:hypothetical protein